MSSLLRIGILGAAPIAVQAVIRPARKLPDVMVAAVAARELERAKAYAARHNIPNVQASYAALVNDPSLDAVYIPLPNSLHAEWTLRALEAGKHVLCEKPLAANGREAALLAEAAATHNRVLCEAFHYRYHPLAARLKTILESGEIGSVRHIEAEFSLPLLNPRSVQFSYELAGGATMDVGCYVLNLIRFLAEAEPQVTSARAKLLAPQVDRFAQADLEFADGRTARMTCGLLSSRGLRIGATVRGTHGEMQVIMPFLPHYFNWVGVRTAREARNEQVRGATTYDYQLAAFTHAIRTGARLPTDARDAVANMRLIDAIYHAAGLQSR